MSLSESSFWTVVLSTPQNKYQSLIQHFFQLQLQNTQKKNSYRIKKTPLILSLLVSAYFNHRVTFFRAMTSNARMIFSNILVCKTQQKEKRPATCANVELPTNQLSVLSVWLKNNRGNFYSTIVFWFLVIRLCYVFNYHYINK